MVLETSMDTSFERNEQDIIETNVLLSEGKRNYVCNQPHLALDCFVELCEKLAKTHGQESEKCIEAYLYYGKTLLDIARLENGVLGHAIMDTPVFGSKEETDDVGEEDLEKNNAEEEEDPLKPDEIRTQVERALREENMYNKDDDEDDEMDINEDNKENVESSIIENEELETSTSAVSKPDKSVNCEISDDEDDGDVVSSLELSWEMLELTAVICKRQLAEKPEEAETLKCTLAEAKHGLAQISLEMERYEDAAKDFTECLDLYKEVIGEEHSRVIAEGHYNIGLALSFDKKYVQAVEWFEKAVTILKARVADLEAKVKNADEKAEMEVEDWKMEILELNDLVVLDMMAKIEDAQESEKAANDPNLKGAAAVLQSKGEFDIGFSAKPMSTNEVVHDCTGSIRSKRKNEETKNDTDTSIKQSKSDVIST